MEKNGKMKKDYTIMKKRNVIFALLICIAFGTIITYIGYIANKSMDKLSNEALAIDWIFKAKKPIVCYPYSTDAMNCTIYTLIDANSGVYMTGRVKLALPDTIK